MRQPDASFRAFPQFERPELIPWAKSRKRMGHRIAPVFDRGSPQDRVALALADRRVLALKEVLESFEFHSRTRKRLRSTHMVDLCCGHGLTGMLFAAERSVERVLLVDRRRPVSHEAILDAVVSVFPYVRDKIEYVECPVEESAELLERGTSVIAVHACGVATDRCIDVALACEGAIAAMPCCYRSTAGHTPPGIRDSLGGELAADIGRTYRLTGAGRTVDWSYIPRAITPMNRILIGGIGGIGGQDVIR